MPVQEGVVAENERLARNRRGDWLGWDRLEGARFTDDGKYLIAYLPIAHHLFFFDAATFELKRTVLANAEDKRRWTLRMKDGALHLNIRSWTFSPDACFGVEWQERRISVWDLEGSRRLWSLETERAALNRPGPRATVSEDGAFVAVSDGMSKGKSTLTLFSLRGGLPVMRQELEDEYPWRAAYLPQSRVLATITLQSSLYCWDLATGQRRARWTASDLDWPAGPLGNAWLQPINSKVLGVALAKGRVGMWDPLSEEAPKLIQTPSFSGASFAAKAGLVMTWTSWNLDRRNHLVFRTYDLAKRELVAEWTTYPRIEQTEAGADRYGPASAALSVNGERIVWTNREGIHVHDAKTGKQIKLVPPPLGPPR